MHFSFCKIIPKLLKRDALFSMLSFPNKIFQYCLNIGTEILSDPYGILLWFTIKNEIPAHS